MVDLTNLDSFDAHWYYAAAIMWIRDDKVWTSASVTQLEDWATEPIEDGWGNYSSDKLLTDPNLIERALELLKELGLIERVFDKFGPEIIVFNPNWDEFKDKDENTGTPFYRTVRYGEPWIRNAIININSRSDKTGGEFFGDDDAEPDTQLAGEDVWEPLPIDRSNPKYEETIAGIEQAIEEIAADNGFSVTNPKERDNIVDHAKATIKSVKDGKATRGQIEQNLVAPGKWILSKFLGSVLGAAGKSLWTWAVKLLGLLG